MKKRWGYLLTGILFFIMCLTGCTPEDLSSVSAEAFQGSAEQIAGEDFPDLQEEYQKAEKEAAKEEEKTEEKTQESGGLTVHFLDVGQGNAVLAESQGRYMLIDGGARESSSFVVSYLKQQNIDTLDYVLLSHFDEDHLAGAVGALYNFSVGTLIAPDYETDSSIYSSYESAAAEKGLQAVHPKIGQEFSFGSASIRVISPVSYGHEDENQDSVGIILQNGGDRFFIGGDIGLQGEKEILAESIDIQADVMLMNHHGSHVSEAFLDAVSPVYSVISCGADNSYGHPRQDTVELLENKGLPLFRTDRQGTIIAHSSGNGVTFEQSPCNDYTSGKSTSGSGDSQKEEAAERFYNSSPGACDYVLNIHTKKIHLPDCGSVENMDEDNKAYFKGKLESLLDSGYTRCGNCKP